jgi:hypothetical protein
MNIQDFNNHMSRLHSRISSNLKSVIYEQARLIRHDLQARSPVDTGLFRSNWAMSRISKADNSLSISVKNPTPYGHWLEGGADIKGPPWYFPSDRAKSGKLIVRKSRVWAGGLSPSGFVVGGITIVVDNSKTEKRVVKALADGIMGAV